MWYCWNNQNKKGMVITMTMKTKRALAVGGGTALCAVLAILIALRFTPEPETATPSIPEVTPAPSIGVEISDTKPIEANSPEASGTDEPNIQPAESEPDIKTFIDNGGTEVNQNFPEAEKESDPPPPPTIADEKVLTNPDKEPVYEPNQTKIIPEEKSENPAQNSGMHGQKKDDMIYISGFGWVTDEGGGGSGYTDNEMYQNGNKIGRFG